MRSTALLCVLSAVLWAGCAGGSRAASDPPLPSLPLVDGELDEEGRYTLVVGADGLEDWTERMTRVHAGPVSFLVRYPGPHDDEAGNRRPSIALWIRGRGSSRPYRSEAASGPIHPDTMENWDVELKPGAYELSVSLGGDPGRVATVLAF